MCALRLGGSCAAWRRCSASVAVAVEVARSVTPQASRWWRRAQLLEFAYLQALSGVDGPARDDGESGAGGGQGDEDAEVGDGGAVTHRGGVGSQVLFDPATQRGVGRSEKLLACRKPGN